MGGQGPRYPQTYVEFRPWTLPSSSSASRGRAASRPVAEAGMLKITQWTKSMASWSSMISAKLLVLEGAFVHARAGDVPAPSHEYSGAIVPSFAKAGLESVNGPVGSGTEGEHAVKINMSTRNKTI